MRIVGGKYAGRDLTSPRDWRVRPTAEHVRAALLDLLAADVAGARVLDLYAGTGALGLEALSRGAKYADFVEFRPTSLAALKANVGDLPPGGVLIVNTDEFTKRNLTKVGYAANPLEDDSLAEFQVHPVAMATLTRGALEETGLSKKDAERAKNMFALGLLSWMYHRPYESTERFLREKFARRPEIAEANILDEVRAQEDTGELEADEEPGERDKLFRTAAELCIQHQGGSTSLLQRRMRIGYGRAARIMDQLEKAGILGPPDGSKPRDVLVDFAQLESICGTE